MPEVEPAAPAPAEAAYAAVEDGRPCPNQPVVELATSPVEVMVPDCR